MTNQEHNKFQKSIDSAVNALKVMKKITLADKDMNATKAMLQYDMLEAFRKELEDLCVLKHNIMEVKNN